MTIRVLIADDDEDVRLLVRVVLSMDPTFTVVGAAATPDEAVALATEMQPDLVVIDQGFRGAATGIETAPDVKRVAPASKLILFSAYDNLHDQIRDTPAIDAFVLKTDVHGLAETAKALF